MPRLPLTVPLAWRETAPSYVSRIAARNGVNAPDFCRDMGTTFRAVLDGDPAALGIIGDVGGVARDRVSAWSATSLGGGVHVLRGHRFHGKTLYRPRIKGCPECLRNDAASSDLPPHQAMATRGHWQLPYVAICLKHRRYLVTLFHETSAVPRYDTCRQFERIADGILSGSLDGHPRRAFGFDDWLDERLADGQGDDWLSGHPLHAAATFCLLLGSALLRLEGRAPYQIPEGQHDILREMGYGIARQGEDGIRRALERIQACAKGPQDGPKRIFPVLYDRLAHDYADVPDYAPFRRILREHMLAHWPLGPGDDLLGEPVMERRLHSVLTASQATGVDPRRLRKVLAAKGLVSESGERRPDAWDVFEARAAEPILATMTQLVPARDFAASIGATRSQFDLLAADGILAPAVATAGTRAVWDPRDGEAFLAQLLKGAVQLRQAQHEWTHIAASAQRLKIRPGRIVEAILAGRIRRIGNLEGRWGYAAVYVDHAEVTGVLRPENPSAHTIETFAKAVGIAQPADLRRLILDGHIPATTMQNPRTRADQHYITAADAQAFHERFMTLGTMAQAYGRSWQSLGADLARHGIMPFSPSGRDYGLIYLRDEIMTKLGERHR